MSTKLSVASVKLDSLKLAVALLIIVSAVVAFYFYLEQPLLYRVLGLLLATGVSVVIGLQTERGRQIKQYFVEAQIEVRKVLWPSWQETVQTTLLVVAMVIVVAILLWCVDALLGWGIRVLMGHEG